MLRQTFLVSVIVALILAPADLQAQAVADQIGLTSLRARLGASTPDGTGISLMLVEGELSPGRYLPDPTTPELATKSIIDRSGGGLPSSHATNVASIGFGRLTGIAPGVRNIDAYRISFTFDSGDWLSNAYLNYNAGLPVAEPALRLQNHSWAAGPVFSPEAIEVVRRFDYAIRRDNTVAVVGIANQTGSDVPAMLGSSYNAIAVGNSNGASSFGPTTGDVPGRSKPDIVGPYGVSSYSTPTVSACAAILMQTADTLGNTNRSKMETIKAVLLSGATKDEFASLSTPWHRADNGSFIEPLDRRFGAGEVNINNSHYIISAAEQVGTDSILDAGTGWDYETLTEQDSSRRYYFETNANLTPFSATTTWLRQITPTGTGADLFQTSLATLSTIEMRLFEVHPDMTLGALVDSSLSPLDNVQHIYRESLNLNQRYALEVRLANLPPGYAAENYAVAWFSSVNSIPEPGAFFLAGFALIVSGTCHRRRRNGIQGLVPAICEP